MYKHLLLGLGGLVATGAVLATVVSCSSDTKKDEVGPEVPGELLVKFKTEGMNKLISEVNKAITDKTYVIPEGHSATDFVTIIDRLAVVLKDPIITTSEAFKTNDFIIVENGELESTTIAFNEVEAVLVFTVKVKDIEEEFKFKVSGADLIFPS